MAVHLPLLRRRRSEGFVSHARSLPDPFRPNRAEYGVDLSDEPVPRPEALVQRYIRGTLSVFLLCSAYVSTEYLKVGVAEAVDRLFDVAHHKERVASLLPQPLQQFVLEPVSVLELVRKYVAEPAAEVGILSRTSPAYLIRSLLVRTELLCSDSSAIQERSCGKGALTVPVPSPGGEAIRSSFHAVPPYCQLFAQRFADRSHYFLEHP